MHQQDVKDTLAGKKRRTTSSDSEYDSEENEEVSDLPSNGGLTFNKMKTQGPAQKKAPTKREIIQASALSKMAMRKSFGV